MVKNFDFLLKFSVYIQYYLLVVLVAARRWPKAGEHKVA